MFPEKKLANDAKSLLPNCPINIPISAVNGNSNETKTLRNLFILY
jgi:hypothetical protein